VIRAVRSARPSADALRGNFREQCERSRAEPRVSGPASCGRAAIGAPGVSFRRFSTAKRKDPTGGDRPARVGANGLLIAAAAGPSSHRSELSAESIASRAIFDFADARQVECSTPTRRMRSNQ